MTLYDSSGAVVSTGYAPTTFPTISGQTYTLQADSYGACTFEQWVSGQVYQRPVTFTATSSSTTFVAIYDCASPPYSSSIDVLSTSASGTPLAGYSTTLWQGGVRLQSCFSPCSFTVDGGQTYQVTVSNYGGETFDHWSDHAGTAETWGGSRSVSVSDSSSTIDLTAVYDP